MIFFLQNCVMFHPNHDRESWAFLVAQPGFEAIEITSGGNTYHGILRRNASGEPSPLILFFYGNGDNAARTMRSMETLGIWPYFLDYHCLVVDYPGYGPGGRGRPSTRSIYRLALAAYDYAKALPEVNTVIAGGYSIGTGPAVYLAAHRDLSGLFLLAPFANGFDLYNSVLPIFYGPLRLLVRNPFPSDEFAKTIHIPALLVASQHDEIIPFRSPQRLNSSFGGETTFVTLSGVGHTGIMFNRTTLDNLRAYLKTIEK
jgi:pimeloyl-ACP methyl ester carboxylesterase